MASVAMSNGANDRPPERSHLSATLPKPERHRHHPSQHGATAIAEHFRAARGHQNRSQSKGRPGNGRMIAMPGDGITDAPALAQAHVGIAMGTGTDVAMESAGIPLVKGDLRRIVRARHLSKATMGNIRQNLFFAFVYNVLGVPLAGGIRSPVFALLLSPMIANAAMTFSSVSVIANALRRRRAQL